MHRWPYASVFMNRGTKGEVTQSNLIRPRRPVNTPENTCVDGAPILIFSAMTDTSPSPLDSLRQTITNKRVALIGLGNRNLGDDGLGPKLVQRLKGRVNALTYETHDGLETVLSSIPADRPELVVVVKAVDLGREPGAQILLSENMLDRNGIGKQEREVRLLMRYIEKESGTPAVLLVIQPGIVTLTNTLSDAVYNSVKTLENFFLGTLGKKP